jgi:ankyrin repeat protein
MSVWDAAKAGDLAEVQRLVGQDPRLLHAKHAFRGPTPLMFAAGAGHLEVVRWLVERGLALDEQDTHAETALYTASEEGRTPVVRLLLEGGADPTVAEGHGWTPLIGTSRAGHVETVRCLLDHPSGAATINQCDKLGSWTALSWACQMGRVDVVRALLEKGADPTIVDDTGRTPMAHAKENARHACVEALEVSAPSIPSTLAC